VNEKTNVGRVMMRDGRKKLGMRKRTRARGRPREFERQE